MRKVVQLAMTNVNFRRGLVSDPKQAIDGKSGNLKFDHAKLSQRSRDVIASFTSEEVDTLYNIYQKAKKAGILILI
ncbi:MAG: hypothetical protein ABJB85_11940 [Nitrososphaerota archaeon]